MIVVSDGFMLASETSSFCRLEALNSCVSFFSKTCLAQYVMHDMAMDVSQSEISAAEAECELFVIKT